MTTGRLRLRLDHTVIAVSDWDRSIAFYRDVLGAEVLHD
jgi:catechol 2,3-dioxygenase-like lactoylglutathione lyase family enzyme